MIAHARELADREGVPNVRFEVGDARAHPFASGAFDIAISRFGTMFFSDPDIRLEVQGERRDAGR